jgi:RNA polymerase sigma-70 factor (ECF subfamily)
MYEKELVDSARKGNTDAWTELYNKHKPRVYSVILRLTKNSALAEDLTQDTFLVAFKKLSLFRGDSLFSTWLHRVAINVALMSFRKGKLKVIDLDAPSNDEKSSLHEALGKDDLNLTGTLDRITLLKALYNVPTSQRVVYILHEIEGYEHSEIAVLLNRSIGNSKSQLNKARARLRLNIKRGDLNDMSDMCRPCADAGFKNIIAHYKGVPKGQSHDGKEHPPMCFDHKHGKLPKHMQHLEDKEVEKPKVNDGRSTQMVRSDNNNYTSLTEEQKTKIRELHKQGFNNSKIGDKLGIKPWRVQRVTSIKVDKIEDYVPERNKHISSSSIINAPELSKEEYESKYGQLGKKGLAQSTLDLWEKVRSLSYNNLLILPIKEGELSNGARGRYSNILQRCIREFKPDFKIKIVAVKAHNHVVLFKLVKEKV